MCVGLEKKHMRSEIDSLTILSVEYIVWYKLKTFILLFSGSCFSNGHINGMNEGKEILYCYTDLYSCTRMFNIINPFNKFR